MVIRGGGIAGELVPSDDRAVLPAKDGPSPCAGRRAYAGRVALQPLEAAGGKGEGLPSLHSSKFAPDPLSTVTTGAAAMITAALKMFETD